MKVLSVVVAAMLSISVAYAGGHGNGGNPGHGGGKGRTKIDFKTSTDSATGSRMLAKFDVSAGALALIPASGSKSHNDDLAGYTISMTIGSATISGTANAKGQVKDPGFDAKMVANGKGFQIQASGLNLVSLLGLDTSEGSHETPVNIIVTASKTDESSNTTTIELANVTPTFKYVVKGTQMKGKNF